nr:programmed cell death protein 7-like [Penaeus vannamei]
MIEAMSGRGRAGSMRSGAVVGLDVISHTLPRRMRSASDAHHLPQPPPTHHLPCCPPPLASLRPAPPLADDACGDGCRECQPDLCPEDDYPGLRRSFAAHVYPSVVTSGGGWGAWAAGGASACPAAWRGRPCPCPRPPACARTRGAGGPPRWSRRRPAQAGGVRPCAPTARPAAPTPLTTPSTCTSPPRRRISR